MKKKLMIAFILLNLIMLSGCTAEYKINIGNNIYEELNITADSAEEYKTLIDFQNGQPFNKYYNDNNIEPYVNGYQDNVDYYDFKSKENDLLVNYSTTFDTVNFEKSNIINKCFETFEIRETKSELYLATGGEFQCLKEGLSSVKVIINTNYEVLYSNADSKFNDGLVWYIDSNNYNNVSLKVNLYKKTADNNKTNNADNTKDDNKDNQITKEEKEKDHNDTMIYLGIGVISFILVLSLVLIISKKKN